MKKDKVKVVDAEIVKETPKEVISSYNEKPTLVKYEDKRSFPIKFRFKRKEDNRVYHDNRTYTDTKHYHTTNNIDAESKGDSILDVIEGMFKILFIPFKIVEMVLSMRGDGGNIFPSLKYNVFTRRGRMNIKKRKIRIISKKFNEI